MGDYLRAEKKELITTLEMYTFLLNNSITVNNFVSGVGALDTLRSLLKCEDHWKINLRQQHEEAYTALWRSLLMIGKIDEALFDAETCL